MKKNMLSKLKKNDSKIIQKNLSIKLVKANKKLEDKILHSSALISSLLDSIPDIIFYKDLNGVYLGCNPAFSEFVGKPREEIIGKTDYGLFEKEIADSFRENDKKMFKTGEPRHNEEWITYPNGRKILLDTLKTPYYGPDKENIGILGVSRDITERNKLEENIKHNLQEQKFLSLVSTELNQYTNFDLVLNDILKKLAIFTNSGRAYIFEDSVDGKATSNTYEWCASGVMPQIDNLKNIQYSSIPAFLKAFSEYGMFKANDVSKISKELRDILEPQGVKSILLLPLFVGGRRLGFFGLDVLDKNRDWKIEEVHLLKNISNSIASVYDRKTIDSIKSEFISVVSHQLKNPLAGIKWLSELLMGDKIEKPSEKQKKYLEDIHLSNERMLKLVEDLLNISNFDSGKKFTLVKEKTDIVQIVDQVLLDNQQLAKEKEIQIIKCEGVPDIFFLNIDGNKIRQVFANLINNAIKYSKNKGVVEIGCEHKNGEVIIVVKDGGIGIPIQQQKLIFSKFFRASNARENEPNGTGLGLYFAKVVVEAHSGKLWFESEENKGSTFYFSLPQ